MKTALRSYLVGMHNPIIHTATVLVSWIYIYRSFPSVKELVCILFHDLGYLKQTSIDGADDRHPEFGAYLCGSWFGKKYYVFCISHSRVYAKKLKLQLSKLGFADKYSILVYPDWFFKILITVGGEAEQYHRTTKTKKWGFPVDVKLIKKDYRKWVKENIELM
jgi:hypothetical protein